MSWVNHLRNELMCPTSGVHFFVHKKRSESRSVFSRLDEWSLVMPVLTQLIRDAVKGQSHDQTRGLRHKARRGLESEM